MSTRQSSTEKQGYFILDSLLFPIFRLAKFLGSSKPIKENFKKQKAMIIMDVIGAILLFVVLFYLGRITIFKHQFYIFWQTGGFFALVLVVAYYVGRIRRRKHEPTLADRIEFETVKEYKEKPLKIPKVRNPLTLHSNNFEGFLATATKAFKGSDTHAGRSLDATGVLLPNRYNDSIAYLGNKVNPDSSPIDEESNYNEVVGALSNLGYNSKESKQGANIAESKVPNGTTEEKLIEALKYFGSSKMAVN